MMTNKQRKRFFAFMKHKKAGEPVPAYVPPKSLSRRRAANPNSIIEEAVRRCSIKNLGRTDENG